MAEIRGFRGLRFQTEKAGSIDTLCCPPYDIISEEQRLAYLARNPYNIIRLELPKGEDPYLQAGEILSSWLKEEILKQDEEESIYIYEESFEHKGETLSVKGFISLVRAVPFSDGIVLPHEETLSKAKTDRFNLMKACFCNFSQIYALYTDKQGETDTLVDKLSESSPDVSFTDEQGVTHRLWRISDRSALASLTQQFADRKLYIADGHHRYETAVNFKNDLVQQGILGDSDSLPNYVMMMLVDMSHKGLVVFPTHRIVRGLTDFDLKAILEKSRQFFAISEISASSVAAQLEECYQNGKKAFALYVGRQLAYLFVLADEHAVKEILPDMSDAYCSLDVSVLHTLVLERIMGIDKENMANQKNLIYTKVYDEAIAAVDNGEADCSFILNPTRIEQIRDVALAGEKMPQKSTYFYPKLTTGLVMNYLKD